MKMLILKLLLLIVIIAPDCMSENHLLKEDSEASSTSITTNLKVDDDFIENEISDFTAIVASDDYSSDKSANFARGKQLNYDDNEAKSSESYGLGYIPLGLLALVVIIPLLLLPILFLFTRQSGVEDRREEPSDLLQVLNANYSLLSPFPPGDPFLRDQSVWSNIVQMDAATQQPFYRLTPENACLCALTGQLYHPQSGLLFSLLPGCYFNTATGRLHLEHSQLDSVSLLPSHLVYEEDTHYVYEPTLSLATDGQLWHLARPPAANAGLQPLRRAQVGELPNSLQKTYEQLLLTAEVIGSPSSSNTVLQNPLVQSKIDFAKPQPADMVITPRGSIPSIPLDPPKHSTKVTCCVLAKTNFFSLLDKTQNAKKISFCDDETFLSVYTMIMSPLKVSRDHHTSPSDLTVMTTFPEDDELQKEFAFPLFLMEQFNVYYFSWLKNPNYIPQYFDRFSIFFKKLHKLPEFWALSESRDPSKLIFRESYKGAMFYRRKLFIQINALSAIHCSSEKQFKVLLTTEDNANEDANEENLHKDTNGRIVFGNLEMKEGAKFCLSLPRSFNHMKTDFKLILALVDTESDEYSPTEYRQIVIAESSISGFKGYQVTEEFQIEEHSSLVPIKVYLSVEWRIDVDSFSELAPDYSVDTLNKLPGAIFTMGPRYWHFVRDFYFWAATKSLNSNIRYCAMRVFPELSMCLPSQAQYSQDLASTFVSMYLGLYPGIKLLTILPDSYITEPLSILESIIFIFQNLSISTQNAFLVRLKPWIPSLVKTRFNLTKRLFSLLSYELGCYESDQIEEVVMPLVIEVVFLLTTVRSPSKELQCQRGSSISWKMVQSFLSQLAHIVVDCLHQVKPQEWPILSLEHEKMTSVRQCLELLMRSLFNPFGVHFLRTIYHAMHKDDGLSDEHLLPFITEETVKLMKQWLSAEERNAVQN